MIKYSYYIFIFIHVFLISKLNVYNEFDKIIIHFIRLFQKPLLITFESKYKPLLIPLHLRFLSLCKKY